MTAYATVGVLLAFAVMVIGAGVYWRTIARWFRGRQKDTQ